jgi:hypothetical protein
MANEFKHKDPGAELTSAEFIAACGDGHIFACQATGDIAYASSATVLSKLGKGAAGTILNMGGSCIPAWTATPTIGSTSWCNAGHAHAASNSGGTVCANVLAGTTLKSCVVTSSLTTVGALNSGSIACGFGAIDNGSSTITTTGLISGGSLDIDDVLINGTTIGHTCDTDLITVGDHSVTIAGDLAISGGCITLTGAATDVDLIDNTASALSFDASGKTGIIDIVTTNGSEGVTMSGTLGVTGVLTATGGLAGGAICIGSSTITTTGLISGGSLDIDNVLINGTTIGHTCDTDLLTLGNATLLAKGTVTVGVDGTGHDVKLFGCAAGAYMEWDESANLLEIRGATAAGPGHLKLTTGEATVVACDVLGKLEFQAPAECGTDAVKVSATIAAVAQGTFAANVNATDLIFYTGHDNCVAERFRFTSQGEIGIAGANYGSDGQVLTSTGCGTAVAWEDAGGPCQATACATAAETNQCTYIPPDLLKYSPGVAKAFARANKCGVLADSTGISCITRDGTGQWSIIFSPVFGAANNYAVIGMPKSGDATTNAITMTSPNDNFTNNTAIVYGLNDEGALADPSGSGSNGIMVVAFGDL